MRKVIHVNVLQVAGITPAQYSRMGQGQVIELLRFVYSLQPDTNQDPNQDNSK